MTGVLRLGVPPSIDAPIQFLASRFDALSFKTTPVEIFYEASKTKATHATGFFWKSGTRTFLITNWHVVTSRDPLTLRWKNEWSLPTSRLSIYGVKWAEASDKPGYIFPGRTRIDLPLRDANGSMWRQHRNFREHKIDIVAIELPEGSVVGSRFASACLNETGFEKLYHQVGADLFVVGYPLENYTQWMLPVWKRCSFASEPLIGLDGRPMLLLDGRVRSGMSGSPVFRRVFGPAVLADMSMRLDAVVTTEFVGVYAGRLEAKNGEPTDLGSAWYGSLIDEIISDGVPGTLE